jgi:hypothetical protein
MHATAIILPVQALLTLNLLLPFIIPVDKSVLGATEVEEMCGQFQDDERVALRSQLNHLLADSQVGFTLERLRKCQELLASAHASLEANREQ